MHRIVTITLMAALLVQALALPATAQPVMDFGGSGPSLGFEEPGLSHWDDPAVFEESLSGQSVRAWQRNQFARQFGEPVFDPFDAMVALPDQLAARRVPIGEGSEFVIFDDGTVYMTTQTDPGQGFPLVGGQPLIAPGFAPGGGVVGGAPPLVVGSTFVGIYNDHDSSIRLMVSNSGTAEALALQPRELRTLPVPGIGPVTATVQTTGFTPFEAALTRGTIYRVFWDGGLFQYRIAESSLR